MELMNQYKQFYVGYSSEFKRSILLGISQHARYKICRQILVASSPLLKEKYIEPLKQSLNEIKIAWDRPQIGGRIFSDGNSIIKENFIEAYLPFIDLKLDSFLIDIQLRLEESGKYFTSQKGSGGLF